MRDAGGGGSRTRGIRLTSRLRGCSPLLVLLAVVLTLVAGCTPTLQEAPPGSASQIALANAVSALDPKKQGTEAWQRQNGPYAWAYKLNVGSGQGQNRLMMYYVLNDYGPVRPPLGTANDTQFVAKMKQISEQYQQADPN